MAHPDPTFVLQLRAPNQAQVVEAVSKHLVSTDAPIGVEVFHDLVVFRGDDSHASLRRHVGDALIRTLGPNGWYDYFRPIRH